MTQLNSLALSAFVLCFSINLFAAEKVISHPGVVWKQIGPGMSGYNEEFWCHPTDTNTMFIGPDMHVSYGTWDGGKSWHTLKDCDGEGVQMERVVDIEFSLQNPDFGMALDRSGEIAVTEDRGRTWAVIKDLGNRQREVTVDPNNDTIWYVGSGNFWDVKDNHKTEAMPHGIPANDADYGHIWKTIDKGKSWKKITKDFPSNMEVARIIVNPADSRNLIMATNYGVYTSHDAGENWKESVRGLPNNLPRDMTFYYNKESGEFVLYLVEQTVYVDKAPSIESRGGVFISEDAGASWKSITGNLYTDFTRIKAYWPNSRMYKSVGYWFGISDQDSKKKFKAPSSKVLSVYNRIAVNPLNKDIIYLGHNKKHDKGFGPGDLWMTRDGGKNWFPCARSGKYWLEGKEDAYWKGRKSPIGTNVEFAHLQPHMDSMYEASGLRHLAVNAAGEVFIGIDQQTLLSTDNGDSWKQIDDNETEPGSDKWMSRGTSDLPGRLIITETGIPGRKLFCSGEHGLWQTADLGAYPDEKAVALEQIEGQVHHKGAHSISTAAVHPEDPDTIFILVWRQEHRGKLRRTTDGGKTWENIATILEAPGNSRVPFQNSLTIDPTNPDNMYFCTTLKPISEVSAQKVGTLTTGGYGFYRSFDGGYTWELKNWDTTRSFHKSASIRRLAMHPDDSSVIYTACNDNNGGLYKTDDKGSTWNRVKTIPREVEAVNNVFIDRTNNFIYISAGLRNGGYKEGGVWRSRDDGGSWEKIFEAPFVWQCETSPVNPDLIVISSAGRGQAVNNTPDCKNPGVFLSQDGGENWYKINRGLGQPNKVTDVKPDPVDEHVLWCALWGSGWYKAVVRIDE